MNTTITPEVQEEAPDDWGVCGNCEGNLHQPSPEEIAEEAWTCPCGEEQDLLELEHEQLLELAKQNAGALIHLMNLTAKQ